MRAGEFADGSRVLRAKIDMQHENMQLRDPVMYRIRRGHHWRTGDDWVIYPTYDWAHGQSDAIEGVTHSLCTLEFDSHRALYDWYLEHLPLPCDQPRQTEFARLELTHTVTSKRKLATLVADGVVDGWDDPRMPTLRGPASPRLPGVGDPRRSATSSASPAPTAGTRSSCSSRSSARELNATAQRRMAVLRPLRVGHHQLADDANGNPVVEHHEVGNNPENADDGVASVPFSKVAVHRARRLHGRVAPPKYFRLTPGREVRLRGAYLVTCTELR